VLIFTVENADEELAGEVGYRLNPHGRYSHGEDYLRRSMSAAGLDVLSMTRAVLRMESGCQVIGLLVSARKPAEH
jgi:predicted TPR repeat methyltransferase